MHVFRGQGLIRDSQYSFVHRRWCLMNPTEFFEDVKRLMQTYTYRHCIYGFQLIPLLLINIKCLMRHAQKACQCLWWHSVDDAVEGCLKIQLSIVLMESWVENGQMEFNPDKCRVKHFGTYTVNGGWTETLQGLSSSFLESGNTGKYKKAYDTCFPV